MKKSERLNDMLLYLSDKKSFNLKDIMNKYSISKSTALRDIQSLEEIGMPIYSKSGRNGYYGILPNRLLSPIVFTVDEVQAMYFTMQTLKSYQSTPFHVSIERLKEKFEKCISEGQILTLQKMEKVFSLGNYQSKSECNLLKDIIQMSISESVCKISYIKQDRQNVYYVQFFNITSAYGQWYATGYNFETKSPQVFRCDKIQSVSSSEKYAPNLLTNFLAMSEEIYRGKNAIDFEIGISYEGLDIFHKEHYPSMELFQEMEKYYVRGFFNKGEESFIANYLLIYGDAIISIEPDSVKTLLLEKLSMLQEHIIKCS